MVQLYNEGYTDIMVDDTAYISYFKTIPSEVTDTGQGLDMASILAKYYTGFIEAVKSNRLFTFQFLLNQIDINKFTHITPVWIEKFSNFFFAKKVLNWEAGRVCNVEMLQLRDSGAVGVVPELLGLELTFVDITNITEIHPYIADPSNVADWNTFFDLPTNGTPFTSVEIVGNTARLIGGANIELRYELFYDTYSYMPNTSLVSIVDYDNCIVQCNGYSLANCYVLNTISFPACTHLEPSVFQDCSALSNINVSAVTSIGQFAFTGCAIATIDLPNAVTIEARAFDSCAALTAIYLPLATDIDATCFANCINLETINLPSVVSLGGNVLNNTVFYGITGQTITLTIPSALMTCNSGSPDGDIQFLQANNTVTIITV